MSGNGDHRYTVVETARYRLHRIHLEERWPQLVAVFAAVFRQLSAFPKLNAGQVRGSTWLHKTQEGAYAPSIWIFFEIDGHEVRLQAALANGRESYVL
jgi:hypothetical protein